ncbi:Beta-galactosidase [Tritrichomonas foetus]|uniref:Beta-galactosidase n=1 Tax=Tritrichomonas foetus TaxID=1144522 RepID=A0A1J4KNG1_9EUKA|nr:Beta-galactosidase [Tritrichomonas foetus]|eukprot:OHT11324.1 Beta-galactosidase [Tritrichomonas foetus]
MGDIVRFIQICQKYDLYVILRPGPFICAEWDFGGLPYWLLQEEKIQVRTSDPVYMKHATEFLTVLYEKVKPLLYCNGGNIIMVQVENEYGFYPYCDHDYMNALADLAEEKLGKDILLFTVDSASQYLLDCGALKGRIFATVDFGTGDPTAHFELQRNFNGGGPYVNSEFYPGWLDHWEEAHHKVSTDAVTSSLDKMLALDGNVNFYMYIGGTNFYFYNGANGDRNSYQADPTSYDYDAPLSECGDMTWKYEKVKETIAKYLPVRKLDVKNTTKKAYGKVTFTEGISLYDALPTIAQRQETADSPKTFEALDVDFGFVLYQTTIQEGGSLKLKKVHDRANVFVDKQYVGTVVHAKEKAVEVEAGKLDILVENQGRMNYGGDFVEFKGLTDGVTLDGDAVTGWTMSGFNLTNIEDLKFNKGDLPTKVPSFYRATFEVDEVADTFLNPFGFKKGCAFINGQNIGRYWTVGPQLTLYVPQYFLHKGTNELIIFEVELQKDKVPTMQFDDTPQIDII